MVDTPFFERKPKAALEDEDIARVVTFASRNRRTWTSTRS